jgi:four helix bundle protein
MHTRVHNDDKAQDMRKHGAACATTRRSRFEPSRSRQGVVSCSSRLHFEMLSFQRLDVYQRAIEFLALVGDIVGDLPKGDFERADQLVRAAESVVRNIAEGAGRWSEADSAKHYKIARGEAMECAASLDVMKLRKVVAVQRYEHGIRLLESVVAMLTKMI